MRITKEQLKKLGACSGGIEWLETQKDHSLTALVKAAIKEKTFVDSTGETEDTLNFANWGITRLMDKPQRVRYAVYAAEQVIASELIDPRDTRRILIRTFENLAHKKTTPGPWKKHSLIPR